MAWICLRLTKISDGQFLDFNVNEKIIHLQANSLMVVGIAIASLSFNTNIITSLIFKLDESKNKTQDISLNELFKSGIHMGKDLLKNTINPLFLSYLGISITVMGLSPTLPLFSNEIILQEILLAISGGIGSTLAIPITAINYAFFNHKKTIYKTTSDNKLDGKRSLKLK